MEYNERNGITPQSIIKPIDMSLIAVAEGDYVTVPLEEDEETADLTPDQREQGTFAEYAQGRNAPHKEKGHGWFASFLSALFGTLERKTKNDLRAQGAFA